MSTLSERLKEAMEQNPETNQIGLARACGIRAPSVSDWLSGKTKKMEGANLLMAAEYLGVNPWWLATGKGGRQRDIESASARNVPVIVEPSRTSEAPPPGYVRLRTFDATPYMGGAGVPVDFPEVLGYVDVLREYLVTQLGCNPDNLDLLPVRGDSMKGTVEHGDIVFVDRTVRTFDGDGVYVIVWNDGLMVKRLQSLGRGGLKIKSDNANYDPIEVAPAETEQLTICGRVTGSWAVRRI